MTEGQKALGILGAIACGIIGLNMTDSGSGALAGAVGGFVIGSTIPVIANIALRIVMLAVPLLAAVFIILIRLPDTPETVNLFFSSACAHPLELYLWWQDDTGG